MSRSARKISDVRAPRDQPVLFGSVASLPTAWRVLDRARASSLSLVRKGRVTARERARAAGAGPGLSGESFLDIDATTVIAHSDKLGAAGTFKHTFGFRPPLCDRIVDKDFAELGAEVRQPETLRR